METNSNRAKMSTRKEEKMSDAKAIMEMIKEHDITYVDLRFTDIAGKMQHVTQHIDTIDEACTTS